MQKSLQQSTGALRFTLTNDYLFHIVFQENMDILRGLLCCLLRLKPEQILSIVLENPIDPHDHHTYRHSRLYTFSRISRILCSLRYDEYQKPSYLQ